MSVKSSSCCPALTMALQSETYTPATPRIQAQYPASPDLRPHGTSGPVGSSYPPFSFDQIKLWFSGWASLGVLVNSQSNAGRAVGAIHSSLSLAQPNVSRSSASDAYFKGEPSSRENLDLLPGHRVVKILFEGTKATAVRVSEQDQQPADCLTDFTVHGPQQSTCKYY